MLTRAFYQVAASATKKLPVGICLQNHSLKAPPLMTNTQGLCVLPSYRGVGGLTSEQTTRSKEGDPAE